MSERTGWFGRTPLRPASLWTLLAWAIILGASLTLWIRYPVGQALHHGAIPGDFAVYFRAWDRVSHGLDPYVATDPSPYKYSPGILAMMGLLPTDSIDHAWFIFGTASILSLTLGLLIGSKYRDRYSVLALVLGLLLAWKGILETLDYGQLELLIFGLAALSTVLLRRASFVSGVLAGTLPWIKLPWGLLFFPMIVILLSRRGAKLAGFFSGGFAACFVWGAMVPALLYGSERSLALSQSWVALLKSQPDALYTSNINQSVWISVTRWFGGAATGQEHLLALGVVATILGLVVGRMTQKTAERGDVPRFSALAAISPWLILIQLLNPLSWRWGSLFAVGIPFAALGTTDNEVRRGPLRAVLALLVLGFWLLQQNPVAHLLGFTHWSEFHSWGLITMYWIGLLLLAI